jgi:hypothetical protein
MRRRRQTATLFWDSPTPAGAAAFTEESNSRLSIHISLLSPMSVKVLPVAEAAIQARDQWSPYVDNGGYVD